MYMYMRQICRPLYTDRWLLFVCLIHGPMSVLGDGEGADGKHAAGGRRLQPRRLEKLPYSDP